MKTSKKMQAAAELVGQKARPGSDQTRSPLAIGYAGL
jgi:hypothetical protein